MYYFANRLQKYYHNIKFDNFSRIIQLSSLFVPLLWYLFLYFLSALFALFIIIHLIQRDILDDVYLNELPDQSVWTLNLAGIFIYYFYMVEVLLSL